MRCVNFISTLLTILMFSLHVRAEQSKPTYEKMPWEIDSPQVACASIGSIDIEMKQEFIRQCFDETASSIMSIYFEALKEEPNIKNSILKASIEISKEGKVISCAAAEGTTTSIKLTNSLCKVILVMSFPKSLNGWKGVYPLHFL